MNIADYLSKPRTSVVPTPSLFPPIDIDGTIKSLRLKQLAKENGERDLPASGVGTLDSPEQSIVNEIENEGKTCFSRYLDNQRTYALRSAGGGQGLLLEISGIAGDASAAFERQTRVGTGELYACKRDVIDTERELAKFRAEHSLTRPARDYGGRTAKVGALIAIMATEAILNGYFLSKGNQFGLLGGVFLALILAGFNVLVGATVGRLVLPWLIYRRWIVRILAAAGAVTYLAGIAAFNLGVAHYRNAVSTDPFEAAHIAYQSFLLNPLALNDLESWALFLIGFCFSLAASYKGLQMDDPYPGYGQRMKQNLDALSDYTEMKEDLLADLEEIHAESEKKLDGLIRSVTTQQQELAYVVTKSQTLTAEMLNHFDHLERAANTLLQFYRNENCKCRKSEPPPHFSTQWRYNRPVLEEHIATEKVGASFDDVMRRISEEAPKQRELLHSAYKGALAEYRRVDDLVA